MRYNLRALGYSALMHSGITLMDLNRYYALLSPDRLAFDESQCERRRGKYGGQHIEWPDCDRGLAYGTDVTVSVELR